MQGPQSYFEKPKYLIIELFGSHDWLHELQERVHYDLNLAELMQFFLEQFKTHSQAALNMEYSLIEMYTENHYSGNFEEESTIILNECRKMGLRLLQYLEMLGCFQNDRLDYCFATVMGKDTFMFWRPTHADVH